MSFVVQENPQMSPWGEEFQASQTPGIAPSLVRHDDGTVSINWQDTVRARWYEIAPELIEQMVTTHNEKVALARIVEKARSYVSLRWDFAEDAFSTDVSARCAMDAAWLELVAACTEDETP